MKETRRNFRIWNWRGHSRGFTLIEMIVVLAVLAILAGFLAPLALRVILATQTTTTGGDLETLYRAIIGDQKQTFGFFGDVGDYPASVVDLVRQPVDGQGKPLPGWKGPYLNTAPDTARGGQLTDAWGGPFEYYVVNNIKNLPDRLAIISKGPDGLSTNASTIPNAFASFLGTAPTDNTYLNQPNNSDNLTFPQLDSANNDSLLRVFTIGSFAPTILNFDSNPVVNAFVSACPSLFMITQTSVPRGSADVSTDKFAPGMVIDLPQGFWQITITAPLATTIMFSQTITILPNATLTPTINFTGVDSRFTPKFTLTVVNQFARIKVDVEESGEKLDSVKPLTTQTFNVHGCAPMRILDHETKKVLDQFTMAFKNFTRIVGTPPHNLTVINNTIKKVKVFLGAVVDDDDGVQIGVVRRKTQKTFIVNTGDIITITDGKEKVLQTFTMPDTDVTVSF